MTNGTSLYNTVLINDVLVHTTSATVFDSADLAPEIYDTSLPILGVTGSEIRKIEIKFYGTNICGTTVTSAILTVNCPKPSVTASWNKSIIKPGEIPVLTWSVTPDTSTLQVGVIYPGEPIEVIDNVALSGNTEPALGKTNYPGTISTLFYATSYCGEVTAVWANVDIVCPTPTITASWTPSSVVSGASSTLSWSTTDATVLNSTTINQFGVSQTILGLPLSGSSPSAPGLTNASGKISVLFVAANDCGQTKQFYANLTISAPTPTPAPTKTPTPVPTKTPTPVPACSIVATASGGGTIINRGSCAGDNNIVVITVSLSLPFFVPNSGYNPDATTSWGVCSPPGPSIKVTNSLGFNGASPPYLNLSGSGLTQMGRYVTPTSITFYVGAAGAVKAGTYNVYSTGGLAKVTGACQNNKVPLNSNTVTITVRK
jgi:hypothetical protein